MDWPVVAARSVDPGLRARPVVVRERIGARDLIRAASSEARADGVRVGMRRREAEACCCEVEVVDADPAVEARVFELVARAVEQIAPRLELGEPGRLLFPTRGPSRYFGGDAALAAKVCDVVMAVVGESVDVRVGIADGRFAARLAARQSVVVAEGLAAGFLAPFPVVALGDSELAGQLVRLGITTIGDFAALPGASVLARFGVDGARRHAMALGDDPVLGELGVVPIDRRAEIELDPPATRVDSAAFSAKILADRLVSDLARTGLACTRVLIEAETEHGEQLARIWRHEDGFTAVALGERVRWQLDGWLAARVPVAGPCDARASQDANALAESGLDSTTGALTKLVLEPEEVVPIPARQLGFFGGDAAAQARADRALCRVQGLLGYDAVGTFVMQGGRAPRERARFVPWGEPRVPLLPIDACWPGDVPPPSPSCVFDPALPAVLADEGGETVRVSGRGEASSSPARVHCEALPGGGGDIIGWAGPWPIDVRWWDRVARDRGTRWQLLTATTAGEVACLVHLESGRAYLEAVYD